MEGLEDEGNDDIKYLQVLGGGLVGLLLLGIISIKNLEMLVLVR